MHRVIDAIAVGLHGPEQSPSARRSASCSYDIISDPKTVISLSLLYNSMQWLSSHLARIRLVTESICETVGQLQSNWMTRHPRYVQPQVGFLRGDLYNSMQWLSSHLARIRLVVEHTADAESSSLTATCTRAKGK
jgi:hypothetical protein